jgi:hypothetical protein
MTEKSTASTRYGDIMYYYSREVEPRPFSRFTSDDAEQQANDDWIERALSWGSHHFDEYGRVVA